PTQPPAQLESGSVLATGCAEEPGDVELHTQREACGKRGRASGLSVCRGLHTPDDLNRNSVSRDANLPPDYDPTPAGSRVEEVPRVSAYARVQREVRAGGMARVLDRARRPGFPLQHHHRARIGLRAEQGAQDAPSP